jgi:hypothetical protein
MAVLLTVRAVSIPVFEVEPEVLDGLAFQLLANKRMHQAGEIAVETDQFGQILSGRAPLSKRLERQFPELLCGVRPEQMCSPIYGVNRLTVRAFTREVCRQPGGYRVEAFRPSRKGIVG